MISADGTAATQRRCIHIGTARSRVPWTKLTGHLDRIQIGHPPPAEAIVADRAQEREASEGAHARHEVVRIDRRGAA